jgi:hypothetical protein
VRWSSREESICGVGGSRPRRYCPPARYAQGAGCSPPRPYSPEGNHRPREAAPSGSSLSRLTGERGRAERAHRRSQKPPIKSSLYHEPPLRSQINLSSSWV